MVYGDLTDPGRVDRIVGEINARFGRVDILVNNAGGDIGVGGTMSPTGGKPEPNDAVFIPLEDVKAIIDRNLLSCILACKAVVPGMRRLGGGSIINTASVAGLAAGYGPFAYSVAKGAVVHLTRVAAAALAKHAIRVNAICPGLIPTSIFGIGLGESLEEADRRARDISERAHGFQPIRVAGSPEDIGYAVAYFASDISRFVTGQSLAVDGGLTVGPREAWDESAAFESLSRIGVDGEQLQKMVTNMARS